MLMKYFELRDFASGNWKLIPTWMYDMYHMVPKSKDSIVQRE
jgi:hypothetical protein